MIAARDPAPARYDAAVLVRFATQLLQRTRPADAGLAEAGLAEDRAATVAEILVEGDLLGHTTHGLQLLAPYLAELASGSMRAAGEPETVADRGAVVTWDGKRLPGPWLVVRAFALAASRARTHGTGTVVIRRSHHIACLAAYLKRVTDQGLVALLLSSDPTVRSVAPFGGMTAMLTPNPIAAGIPTDGDPLLIDISSSTTTNGLTGRLRAAGAKLDHDWLLDNEGTPSRDPDVLFTEPPGTILPLGGVELGHKGFGLAILIEALTAALGGFGRADPAEGWGASVFVQVIDPAAFGGLEAFRRETGWLARAARADTPRPGGPAVRMPGDGALRRRAAQLRDGVALHPTILPALEPWARKTDLTLPTQR
jgi:LDH2 family malate/lactate/ureidoglycolate dehydrogenase